MRMLLSILLLAHACACSKSLEYDVTPQIQSSPSDESLHRFVETIRNFKSATGLPIRVYFQGQCGENHQPYFQDVPFPILNTIETGDSVEGLEYLNRLFSEDETVHIMQDEEKIMRIRIGEPQNDILNTLISKLTLTEDQRYNGRRVINAIENANEIKMESERLGLKQTIPTLLGIGVAPSDRLPSLPAFIERVTMDEALDMVAVTLDDIVIYGECATQYTVRAY